MMTLEQVRIKSEELISRLYPHGADGEVLINEQFVSERERGWVFPYNTEAYLRLKRPQDGLVRNAPVFVDKQSGQAVRMPSGRWERMPDEYDRTGAMPVLDSEMKRISPGDSPLILAGIDENLCRLKS